MQRRDYHNNTSFLDLLFNCLVGFVFLFVVAFLLIKPDVKDASIKTKAEYVITMTWALDDRNDVDIWLMDPATNLISFKNKEAGLAHLDRDDLGHVNDTFKMPDGRIIAYNYNQEILTIRGIIPGEWILNVHMYNNNTKEPSQVTIRIDKLNPKVITVFNETITLTDQWEEKTVLRFTMKNNGDMIGVRDLFTSLVARHPDMKNPRTASSSAAADPRLEGGM